MTHPGWIAMGLALILIGGWLIRWANRNSMTAMIRDATVGVAIDTMTKHGRPNMPPDMQAKIDDIANAKGATGKAKKIASYGVRNSMSQVFGVAGFIMLVTGLMMVVFGFMYG